MRFPPVLLALDILGTALLFLGLFGFFGNGPLLVAGFIDLNQLAVPLIITGALMMAPFTVFFLRSALSGSRKKD